MARSFPGTASNYLTISGASPLTIGGSVDFSMGAWIYPTAATGTIFAKWPESASNEFLWDINSQKLRFIIRRSDDSEWTAQSTANVALNQWTYVMCVRTFSDETHRLYINGAEDGTFDLNGQPKTGSTADIRIGQRGANNVGFTGRIGEISWWNVALTADQRTVLALGANNVGRANPLTVRAQNLLGHWPLWGASFPEPSLVSDRGATQTGSVPQIDHPPIAPPPWV